MKHFAPLHKCSFALEIYRDILHRVHVLVCLYIGDGCA